MKKEFIKFCWGSDRIPQSIEAFERATNKFTIAAMVKKSYEQDKCMISADTCFFKLNLPEYSTLDILK
jgi:other hect domain ubiquitin protein ligase E3